MPAQPNVTQLNIRIPQTLAHELEALAHAEHLEKIDLARQLLWEGIARRKQERALRLYAEGKISKSRAAELAGITVWEMMELIAQRGIRWEYSVEEAKAELAAVVERARQHAGGRRK
jgi:predicted HTH domain antitoxin